MAQAGLWLWVKYGQFKDKATHHHGSVTPEVWYEGETSRVISAGELRFLSSPFATSEQHCIRCL